MRSAARRASRRPSKRCRTRFIRRRPDEKAGLAAPKEATPVYFASGSASPVLRCHRRGEKEDGISRLYALLAFTPGESQLFGGRISKRLCEPRADHACPVPRYSER